MVETLIPHGGFLLCGNPPECRHIEHKVVETVVKVGNTVMAELSDEDRLALERMRRAVAERDAIPPEEMIPVEDPERYEFPIGIDDEGNPFPAKRNADEA
jgi:hypothetical protein